MNKEVTSVSLFIVIGVMVLVGGLLIMQNNEREWKLEDDKAKVATTQAAELQKKKDQQDRQLLYSQCRDAAYTSYIEDWNAQCTANKKAKECSLPGVVSDGVEIRYKEGKDTCLKLYGPN